MPKKDIFHDAVKHALEKDGWLITHDPLSLKIGKIDMYIDLGAETLLAAEKDRQKIAVEIKSFLRTSRITDFYNALGQFLPYQVALEEQEPERILYLAVPAVVYETLFEEELIRKVMQRYPVKLIIYDPETEEIQSWIN